MAPWPPGAGIAQPPPLPAEILGRIVDLAAASEAAPSPLHGELARTSQAVRALSERGRWRSVALTTPAHLIGFASLLGARPAVLDDVAQLYGLKRRSGSPDPATARRPRGPSPRQLCSYLVNLLIDIDGPSVPSSLRKEDDEQGQGGPQHGALVTLQELFIGILHRVTHWSPQLEVMSLSAVTLSGLEDIVRFEPRKQRVRRLHFTGDRVVPQAPPFPHPAAFDHFEVSQEPPLFGPYGPKELTLEWDGRHWTLRSLLAYDFWCPPRDDALAASSSTDLGPSPVYVGLSARLRKLHLIGYDPNNPFDGFAMPVEDLTDSVIAGSLKATYNRLRSREVATSIWRAQTRNKMLMDQYLEAHPRSPMSAEAYKVPQVSDKMDAYLFPEPPMAIPCVTHLRYDTVKFTFRPFEALAPRLKPFFEHLHVVEAPYPARMPSAQTRARNGQARSRHPYHDAVVQAALNDSTYRIPIDELSASSSAGESSASAAAVEAADYHLRAAFGAGAFARLHLAWDPPPPPESSPDSLGKKMETMAVSADESGWPAERRDVWTNHSSASSSSRAGASTRGKTTKSSQDASRPSDASSPFTMELAEAVEHRLQYPFTQRLFEAQSRGTYPSTALVPQRTDAERQVLNEHDLLWTSDTQRSTEYLSRMLGQELLLRGSADLAVAAASSSHSQPKMTGSRLGSLAAADGEKTSPSTAVDLPEGALVDHGFLVEPAFQPELEMVPISPYMPSPASPYPSPAVSGQAALASTRLQRASSFGRPSTYATSSQVRPILKLGGVYAAFTAAERVRLFKERIRGLAGSWPE